MPFPSVYAQGGTSGGCNLLAAGKKAPSVIEGVAARGARIGERTDARRPVWITPEIVTGGFSTGKHLAGGGEKPHEVDLVSTHTIPVGPMGVTRRGSINYWCLTPAGRAWLLDLSRSGLYRLPTAEEGCLLAVAILEAAGVKTDDLMWQVTPWFNELRFFPEPADSAPPDGSTASVRVVRDVLLRANSRLSRFQAKLVADQKHMAVVNTVYLSTYRAVMEEAQEFCDWWRDGASDTDGHKINVVRLGTLRASIRLHGFERRERRSCLGQLFDALDVAVKYGRETRPSFVEHIRRLVALASARWAPRNFTAGGANLSRRRQTFYFQLLRLVEELNLIKDPVSGLAEESVVDMSARYPHFKREIRQLTMGTFEELATAGLLSSAEALASHALGRAVNERAVSFASGPTRILGRQILHAFAARRSRLLLNLASQVRVRELPWFAALEDACLRGPLAEEAKLEVSSANSTAKEVFRVYMAFFAGTQMPNKLVDLLGRYLGCKGLVKELAADIFMGSFVHTFGAQAKQREELLGPGTPYGDYYASVLPKFPADAASRTVTTSELGLQATKDATTVFAYSPVENGIAIERVATATTHNLLRLLVEFGMDGDASLLKNAAHVALESFVACLRSTQTDYRFIRDNSRRAAASCRSLMLVFSLLKRIDQVPPDLVLRLKESALGLPEARAVAISDVVAAVEGQPMKLGPLMGWYRSGDGNSVFCPAKKQKTCD